MYVYRDDDEEGKDNRQTLEVIDTPGLFGSENLDSYYIALLEDSINETQKASALIITVGVSERLTECVRSITRNFLEMPTILSTTYLLRNLTSIVSAATERNSFSYILGDDVSNPGNFEDLAEHKFVTVHACRMPVKVMHLDDVK